MYEAQMTLQNGFLGDQDSYSFGYGMLPNSNQGNYSPFSGSSASQESSIPSPMSTSQSPLHGTEYIQSPLQTLKNITVVGDAHLTIREQPVEKFRFRYKSEMIGTHGSLVGANNGPNRKKQAPSVELLNYYENAIIRCTLVTCDDDKRIPHAHKLVKREENEDCEEPHHITVSPENGFIASFHGLGIIHTAKKHIKDELVRKMRNEASEKARSRNINASLTVREEAQIRADAEKYQKKMNLNSVALCFQAFIPNENNVMIPLTEPVYSNPINNLKSALTGELKICRIDRNTGRCEGGEEVFIFVEKVGKKNIKIKFFELSDDDLEVWCDYGKFSELDVHHQYAIAFKTPPYKDINITSPKEVFIQLERPSDLDCSEPIKFTYKPSERILNRKRQRMSYSGSAELSHIIANLNSSAPMQDVTTTVNNDSRDVSKELKKTLLQGCTSEEFLKFIEDFDIGSYMQYLDNNEKDMLTTDGPKQQTQQDDVLFAKNILLEVIHSLKINPKAGKESLQKLFRERSTYGDSALHSALRHDQRDIAKYILMLINTNKDCKTLVNGQNGSGKTPLHYAVLENQPEIARALLRLGADPNTCDHHGFSPLHTVVRKPEHGACVDVLLSDKTTNIEAHNDAGWTPLQLAAEAGSYHAVCALVQAGADVNSSDMSYGRTALHIAVEGGHKDIVEFLLKNTKVDVNKRNFSGNTALHTAVVHEGLRAKEICALLIKYGADPRIQNRDREIETAQKPEEQVVVKQEQESEDESTEQTGQSSFDLALNKPDILKLLSNQAEASNNEQPLLTAKQEAIEIDSHTDWLDTEDKQNLGIVLNNNKGWVKLAKRLNFTNLLGTLEQTPNPSLLLLNYIDIQSSISLPEFENVLREIGEDEAADCVAHVISARS